jgi:hypothetical protein
LLSAARRAGAAAEYPAAKISNGSIRAELYLPDAVNGYYRATRFDWSGVIASLECKGHNFFGVWFPRYDPKLHDSITGPVEEFRTGESALGYEEAKAGGTFIRIGVGVLRRPDEPNFQRFKTYEIVDPGKWTIRTAADSVEFVHAVDGNRIHAVCVSLPESRAAGEGPTQDDDRAQLEEHRDQVD